MFARFSTVAGERGAADAERDIRGFALKFYTEEGNWDVVGNNTPVFFFRDPLRFPDLNHAIKRDPRTGMRSADNNWDFWTLLPEALHQVTIVMSDRGIPRSFRHMHGFGSHTYSFINAKNERIWVKFHFRTQQGIQNLTDAEAEALVGKDRETHQRDLFESIEQGDFPRWTLFIQVMTEAQAKTFPVQSVRSDQGLAEGGLSADRGRLSSSSTGIRRTSSPRSSRRRSRPPTSCRASAISPDKMLQARLFSYGDAQRYRLGRQPPPDPGQRAEMPVPQLPPRWRDAHRRQSRGTPTYLPNSQGEWTDQPQLNEPPLEIDGAAAHWDHRVDDDHYQQPGDLFRKMNAAQQQALFDNTARQVGRRAQAHPGAARRQLHQGRSGLRRRRCPGAGYRLQSADGRRGVGLRASSSGGRSRWPPGNDHCYFHYRRCVRW